MSSNTFQGEDSVIPFSCNFSFRMLSHVAKTCANRGAWRNKASVEGQEHTTLPFLGWSQDSLTHNLPESRKVPGHKYKWKPKARTQKGPPVLVLPRSVSGDTQLLCSGIQFFIFQAWNPSRQINFRAPCRLHGHCQRETGHTTACRTAFWEKSTYVRYIAGTTGNEREWILMI